MDEKMLELKQCIRIFLEVKSVKDIFLGTRPVCGPSLQIPYTVFGWTSS